VAVRPTLDDGSSSDSCDSNSSCSSDGSDGYSRVDSACLHQDNLEVEENLAALPDANSTPASLAAAPPHNWFWSAFISVQRLPGVSFCRLFLFDENVHLYTHTRALVN
jgi:hypothetical protein